MSSFDNVHLIFFLIIYPWFSWSEYFVRVNICGRYLDHLNCEIISTKGKRCSYIRWMTLLWHMVSSRYDSYIFSFHLFVHSSDGFMGSCRLAWRLTAVVLCNSRSDDWLALTRMQCLTLSKVRTNDFDHVFVMFTCFYEVCIWNLLIGWIFASFQCVFTYEYLWVNAHTHTHTALFIYLSRWD